MYLCAGSSYTLISSVEEESFLPASLYFEGQ